MTQLTGRVFITVKGQRVRSEKGAVLRNFGGIKRTGIAGDTGVAGFTEETVIPEIECSIIHGDDVSLTDILAITDETIIFDTDSGRSFVLTNAWCCGELELSDSKVKTKFQAPTCEES
ncbi:phage tail tube protein [Denitratisoma sp. agr-D3]